MLKRIAIMTAIGLSAVLSTLAPASAQNLVPCAQEGEYCDPPYSTTVVYGAGRYTTSRQVGPGGVSCSNGAFGDPAPNRPKACWYVARRGGYYDGPRRGPDRYDGGYDRGWRACATEGQVCRFRGTKRVRYGAPGGFTERAAHNAIVCSNKVFGDPAPGLVKSCYVRD